MLDVVDDAWRTETLPLDDIHVRIFNLILSTFQLPKCRNQFFEIAISCRQFLNLTHQVPATELPDSEADNVAIISTFHNHQWSFALLPKLNLNYQVPATELPDPEADNANPGDSLRQQVSNSKKHFCLHLTMQSRHKESLNLKPFFSIKIEYSNTKAILVCTKTDASPSGGKVDGLGSSHNASRTDPAWILEKFKGMIFQHYPTQPGS